VRQAQAEERKADDAGCGMGRGMRPVQIIKNFGILALLCPRSVPVSYESVRNLPVSCLSPCLGASDFRSRRRSCVSLACHQSLQ
jgi:hypothetical protein